MEKQMENSLSDYEEKMLLKKLAEDLAIQKNNAILANPVKSRWFLAFLPVMVIAPQFFARKSSLDERDLKLILFSVVCVLALVLFHLYFTERRLKASMALLKIYEEDRNKVKVSE